MTTKNIVLFGAGGHAKVVIDIIETAGLFTIKSIVDDNRKRTGTEFCGYPVMGGRDEFVSTNCQDIDSGFIAIGDNKIRGSIADWCIEHDIDLVQVGHPAAVIAKKVIIQPGSVVMPGVIINTDVKIGFNAIINTNSSIDHDCVIGNSVHVGPGVTLCGNVQVGNSTLIGAGSTVAPNIIIGKNVIIGAGTTVIANVSSNQKIAGSPARSIN